MFENRDTMKFVIGDKVETEAGKLLVSVYEALLEGGYNPVNQIVGYLMSGDPTYITNHKGARSLVKRIERDELLEELIKNYLQK